VLKVIRRKIEQYSKLWDKVTVIEKVESNYMGDVFKDINQSNIAARGSIAEGVINLKGYGQEEIAQAISKLDELIAATSEDKLTLEKKKESAELLQGITEEASKQKPNKSALKAFGNTLLSILTSVEPLAKASKTAFEVIKTLWS
jgi:hypothetical protein